LLNYDHDFFEYVRNGKIRVHIADITHLSDHKIHMSTGDAIAADVLICGTGWKDTPQLDFKTDKELGLPGQTSASMQNHVSRADAQILATSPKLQNQPVTRHYNTLAASAKAVAPEPYRLYRFMVPPAFVETRTLAFAGACRSHATIIIAQTQALWITAFLDHRISGLNEFASEQIEYETVLHTQFGKWRYSRGFGARFLELWFECLRYVDLLLKDVGVRNERKGLWFAERFMPYMPKDYVGIVGEYMVLEEEAQ
jgi:hypothetical protein